MKKELVSKLFILSGLVNILGVLTFSKFFTSNVIAETYPVVMSNFGLLMIMVWGLVFIAVAPYYEKVKWLVATFIIEKLVYVISWIMWFSMDTLKAVYEQDVMAGIFYTVYGANDLFFFFFFSWVVYTLHQKEKS